MKLENIIHSKNVVELSRRLHRIVSEVIGKEKLLSFGAVLIAEKQKIELVVRTDFYASRKTQERWRKTTEDLSKVLGRCILDMKHSCDTFLPTGEPLVLAYTILSLSNIEPNSLLAKDIDKYATFSILSGDSVQKILVIGYEQ